MWSENEVFVMKVVLPVQGLRFTSKDVLPASCTSKPQVTCTSAPKTQNNQGLSNQEIYQGLVSVKDRIFAIFGGESRPKNSVNYLI